jgi:hypothetical protein
MAKHLVFAAFVAAVAFGSLAARAEEGQHGHSDGGQHHAAPEPMTMVGLLVGAAALAYAGKRRNRS